MIAEIYGFPVYMDKLSDPEKFLRYIQDVKLAKSDNWNAKCLVSSRHGSAELGETQPNFIHDEIFDELCLHGKRYLQEMNIDIKMSPSECKNPKCKNCRDIWINKYEKGHSQDLHWHVNEEKDILFSFACFLKFDPDKDASFVFVNPIPHDGVKCEKLRENPYFSVAMKPNIEEGSIMIFPPWMLHYVETHHSDEPRISMAGNFYENKSEE
jgi:hypothetical protein